MRVLQEEPLVYLLGMKPDFPDVLENEKKYEDLIAVGGDLSPLRLIEAYRKGIFPWYEEDGIPYWFSPKIRMVIDTEDLKVSKSLQKTIEKNIYEVRFNTDFDAVIENCAEVKRKHEDATWITEPFKEGYTALHQMDVAKSVETYKDGKLVGGLYGLLMKGNFYGESMFSLEPDASKVALVYLARMLYNNNHESFIDCQVPSAHLKSLGGYALPRKDFLKKLKKINY